MKTFQVIISGCWCCVCFPFCLESLRRVEHSCPRFSFSFLFSPGYCFALEFKIIVADFCLFGIVNVMHSRLTKCFSWRCKKTLLIFNVACQVVDWFFFQSWIFLIVLQMQEDLTHLQWGPLTVGLLWTMDGPKDQPAQMIWSPICEIYI